MLVSVTLEVTVSELATSRVSEPAGTSAAEITTVVIPSKTTVMVSAEAVIVALVPAEAAIVALVPAIVVSAEAAVVVDPAAEVASVVVPAGVVSTVVVVLSAGADQQGAG